MWIPVRHERQVPLGMLQNFMGFLDKSVRMNAPSYPNIEKVIRATDRNRLTDTRTFRSILPAQPDQPSEALGLWFDRASRFFPLGDSGGSYTNGMREFGLAHAKPPPQTGN